ncbi:hypothetical protein J6Z19_05405 [bacterium]|nr:hypothetical protein [bacterium]
MIEHENIYRNAKKFRANKDFQQLLTQGNIAFYSGCEVTQIFLFDQLNRKAINYFSLFTFDEIETVEDKPRFLLPKLKRIDSLYSLGVQQQRISLDTAKQVFAEIQEGRLNYDENCDVSKNLVLLPKTYVPALSINFPVFLNSILKPNYWGDNYIIEFFDESKELFVSDENARSKFDHINTIVKSIPAIKIDLSTAHDRIGNIIFQFPITILKTKISSEKDSVNLRIQARYHPKVSKAKNLHIEMFTTYDNIISGFNAIDTDSKEINNVLEVGDDNNLNIILSEKETGLILRNSKIIFCKSASFCGHIGTGMEPRTIRFKDGKEEKIELSYLHRFVDTRENNYYNIISRRNQNNEILLKSGDYKLLKSDQREDALEYIRKKIRSHSNVAEICLWDPYLTAKDIIETLYFEDTGMPFRCITSYQKSKKITETKNDFDSFRKEQKLYFMNNSNNLGVKMKFLAQHDNYGWKFHDRFLIFVPQASTDLPIVYSLGTSVNIIGKNHHIIQKVTNPKEILENFEELWKSLDNENCIVAEF